MFEMCEMKVKPKTKQSHKCLSNWLRFASLVYLFIKKPRVYAVYQELVFKELKVLSNLWLHAFPSVGKFVR